MTATTAADSDLAATPTAHSSRRPGLRVGVVALVASIVLFVIAIVNTMSRNATGTGTEVTFYVALGVLYLVFAVTLFGRNGTDAERIWLVAVFAVALYLVKVLYEPSIFALHDELAQIRSTNNILDTGRLFGGNPTVRAYPYFPGLNASTAVVMRVTHLSLFWSGTLIVGVARLVGALALWDIVTRISGRHRLGAVAVLLYATNPNYLYFDADYSYESLALPLALAALLCAMLSSRRFGTVRPLVVASVLTAALVMTHHVSAYWLGAVLLGWLLVSLIVVAIRRRNPVQGGVGRVAPFAVAAVIAILAWQFGVAKSHTASEVTPAVSGAQALFDKLTGNSTGPQKTLFGSTTGQIVNPLWAQLLALASVALALLILVLGLWAVARRVRWRHPLVLVLCLLSLLLPATLGLRLTQAGTETSNRASEFVYFGLALVGASVISYRYRITAKSAARHRSAERRLPVEQILAAAAVVMFIGGFVIGWAPYERQPGPYLGAAELRSVDPRSVQAAIWAERLPRYSFVTSDLSNSLLVAAYARLNPQTGTADGKPVSEIFYSKTYSAEVQDIVAADKIRYLVVDSRVARYQPQATSFFGTAPSGVNAAAKLPVRSIRKFATAPQLDRIYDNGTIRIYAIRSSR